LVLAAPVLQTLLGVATGQIPFFHQLLALLVAAALGIPHLQARVVLAAAAVVYQQM
jgi:hypothetical protein